MARRIVVVGANAAGVEAAIAARKTDREAEITLVTRENVGAYSRCGLPFALAGQIKSFEDLIVYPNTFYRMMKFNLRLNTEAVSIDVKEKGVKVKSKDGVEERLGFDSLILATGSQFIKPPIKGIEKEGVMLLQTLDDGKKIDHMIRDGAEEAVVLGAGFLGLEAAVALVERGVKTTVVEMLPYVLSRLLDKDMADEVQKMLEEKGLRIIVGHAAEEIIGDQHVEGVRVAGEKLPADFVINACGVRPNVELAQKCGIILGKTGAISTNLRMETNVKDIYAAGDCAETLHLLTGTPIVPALGTTAVRQGKVAGINAAGGYAIYPGALCSAVTKMFDFEVGVTGLTEYSASRCGYETITGKISSKTRADYYPGALPIKVKVVVDKETKRIIGGQIIGGEEVTQRINALSIAIQNHMTVYELAKADTCYAPPLNETWEPFVLAAEMALKRI
ncbi:MAG: FAD-dependent oxidoreductase [Nitrososphaerota archaeon]|nr:FAD-dependent oxidoreductase [Candidatus Bathyarchaeota archaeon]MDW8049207.1 FAD-dependent oxidoreductase [Nitrososphaerota archaeon]